MGDAASEEVPRELKVAKSLPNAPTTHFQSSPSTSAKGAGSRTRDEESMTSSSTSSSSSAMELVFLPSGIYFRESRHKSMKEQASRNAADSGAVSKWRMKDRMKTGCVAIVLCLNIGVDPPDVIKISPCARMECWIDPFSMHAPKALDAIGKNLQTQYERWQPKAKYKVQLDPTVEEVKKLCTSCRKSAKGERVLFHYNGHGVPKPTSNGEIWMFNKNYTQYIPLSVYELESWLGSPSIYVFDCSSAGMIVNAFCDRSEWGHGGVSFTSLKDCILLASCSSEENLPQNPEFPADIFTSCLTTPIEIALKWFCHRSLLKDILKPELIDEIPGRQNDRKTPLGELNWIFTAITDTIAWNVLPRELFQRLFRQDLLVASLFRNFLLADRILRAANCTPVSYPRLPPTHQHPMWHAWDMAAEICLSQLPAILKNPNIEFKPSPFFSEQLTAFEVWLENGSEKKKPPEQLPIVLQVLLSQSHRLRALILLGRFLDMGPWAVDLALSVGIFPYVLKLLQTTSTDLRHVLVFIWAKILALDKSCQVDLVKDNGHQYFIKVLDSVDSSSDSSNPSLIFFQKALSAFVLSVICDNHSKGQIACIQSGLIDICLSHIQRMSDASEVSSSSSSSSSSYSTSTSVSSPEQSNASMSSPPRPVSSSHSSPEKLYLQWLCLCIAKMCENSGQARLFALRKQAHLHLSKLLTNSQPEVRSAAAFSLGMLIDIDSENVRIEGSVLETGEDIDDEEIRFSAEKEIGQKLMILLYDCSPLVRRELVIALYRLARAHNKNFKFAALTYLKPLSAFQSMNERSMSSNSINFSPQTGLSPSYLNLSLSNLQSASASAFLTRSYDAKSFNPILSPSKQENQYTGEEGPISNSHAESDQTMKSTPIDAVSQNSGISSSHSRSGINNGVQQDENTDVTESAFPNQLSRSKSIDEETKENVGLTNGVKFPNSISSNTNHMEENISYIKFVMAMYSLLRDPMPQISKLADHALKCIGIEQIFIKGENKSSKSPSESTLSDQKSSSDIHPTLKHEMNSTFKSVTSPSPAHTRISSFSGFPPIHTNASLSKSASWVNFSTVPSHANTTWRNGPSQASPQKSSLLSSETLRKVPTSIDFNSPIKNKNQQQSQSPYQRNNSASSELSPSLSSPSLETKSMHLKSSESLNENSAEYDEFILHSKFYDWSFHYFSNPLLQTVVDDENGFVKERHELLAKEGIQKCQNSTVTQVSDQIASCDTESNMSTQFVLLHPFSPLVCIADEKEFLRIWNYEEGVMTNMFDNNSLNFKKKSHYKLMSESGISKLCFVNELDNSLLLVASCDGIVKIWEKFDQKDQQNLVTAWHSVPRLSRKARLDKSSKVVVDWTQTSGYLFASGECSSVLAWDLNTENLAHSISTRSEAPLTSISSSQTSPEFFLSGCADGYVRMFDIRSPSSLVIASKVHNHRVVGIDFQSCSDPSLIVSASSQGDIKFLDLRRNASNYLSIDAHKGSMTALAVHKHAKVLASGSAKQYIKVFNLAGEQLSTIIYHNSFLGQRIGPISSLNFHPYNVLLAAGATDSMVSIYAGDSFMSY